MGHTWLGGMRMSGICILKLSWSVPRNQWSVQVWPPGVSHCVSRLGPSLPPGLMGSSITPGDSRAGVFTQRYELGMGSSLDADGGLRTAVDCGPGNHTPEVARGLQRVAIRLGSSGAAPVAATGLPKVARGPTT